MPADSAAWNEWIDCIGEGKSFSPIIGFNGLRKFLERHSKETSSKSIENLLCGTAFLDGGPEKNPILWKIWNESIIIVLSQSNQASNQKNFDKKLR